MDFRPEKAVLKDFSLETGLWPHMQIEEIRYPATEVWAAEQVGMAIWKTKKP